MTHSGEFLGRLLGPLLKKALPLMKNVIQPLAKSALISLGLTTAAPDTDAGIHKKPLESVKRISNLDFSKHNNTTTLIISNDAMKDVIKIVKSLEDSGSLSKVVSDTIQNEAKEQKRGFLRRLLGTLGASLLGDILASQGRRIKRAGDVVIAKRQGRGFIRAGYGSSKNKDF